MINDAIGFWKITWYQGVMLVALGLEFVFLTLLTFVQSLGVDDE